jgi:hypothetical protein
MNFGKVMIFTGVALLIAGALWTLGERIGLGRLPGDIVVRGQRSTIYFPLATSLLLSLVLTLVLNLVVWIFQRGSR